MGASKRSRFRRAVALFYLLTLVAVFTPGAAVNAAADDTFTDDDDSVFETDIKWLWDEGITKGCNPPLNNEYCPKAHVTRGQMAAFLVRAMGYADDGGGDVFIDDDASVFEADIDRLATAEVTKGCNPPRNDRFCPDASVTRGQMAAFLVRAMGYADDGGGNVFIDDDASVFEADIDRLRMAGVTKGCNPPANDRYCPNELVTRGQMAAFLHRAMGDITIEPPPPPVEESATVAGRLLNAAGAPVVDAVVTITSDPVVATTDVDGRFSVQVKPGFHRLTAVKDGVVVATKCFVAVEQVVHDLGDLSPGMPSGCPDPEPTYVDTDGDGLIDTDELAGWTVTLTLGDGSVETRHVSSDPGLFDTDDDGLNDAEEKALLIDPRRPDTDADLLSDYGEMNVYKSLPTVADSDGDSCPDTGACVSNPSLWDGYELLVSKTSPTLADTDGDGLTDYHEIVVGGSNPRLADLPAISLELAADPRIAVAETAVTGCSDLSTSLERESHEYIKTDTEATRMSIENTVRLHTEVKVGTSNWPPSANATLTTDTEFSHSFATETTSNWTDGSLAETESTRECWTENQADFSQGLIEVAMKVRNVSNLALELSELRIVAYRLEFGGSFELVTVLAPDESVWDGQQVLAPQSSITMTVESTDVDAGAMRRLIANPTGLVFDIGSYQLTELSPNITFAELSEWVLERTGVIVVDYGDGIVKRHAVATNVYRNPDGSASGVTLDEALSEIIGVDYETRTVEVDGQAVQALYAVDGRATYPACDGTDDAACDDTAAKGFWLVAGTVDGLGGADPVDLGDVVLGNADRVVLTYLEDRDGDDVFDREEYLLGTNAEAKDSDGDGLTDYQETKEGWEVPIYDPERAQVYPDPRYTDWDLDGVNDSKEMTQTTDPYVADTDGDGTNDLYDAYPLEAPCRDGEALALETWWDGTHELDAGGVPEIAVDVAGLDASNGTLIAGPGDPDRRIGMILEDPLEPNPDPDKTVFLLNPELSDDDQQIEVDDDPAVSPAKPLTISAWVMWLGTDDTPGYQTILAKGTGGDDAATFRLLVDQAGHVRFTLRRWTHVDTNEIGCSDYNEFRTDARVTAEPVLPRSRWAHIAVTFYADGNEALTITINGTDADGNPTQYVKTWDMDDRPDWGVWCEGNRTTTHLLDNAEPLTIGGPTGDPGGDAYGRAFQGAIDDIQIFHRGLLPNEVGDLHELGVCPYEVATP